MRILFHFLAHFSPFFFLFGLAKERKRERESNMNSRRNPSYNVNSKTSSPGGMLRLRVVIVARKADALILCGSSFDPSLSQSDSLSLQAHATRLVHAIVTSNNISRGSIDDGGEHFCYCIKDNIIVVCALVGSDADTQALAYCSSVAAEFVNVNKGIVSNCTRDYELSSFNDRLKAISERENDFTRLTNEIEAVHDAVADNVRQIMVRGDKINEIGDIAEDLRENANKYQNVSKKVNIHAMWMQYKPIVIIVGVAIIIIILRILLG